MLNLGHYRLLAIVLASVFVQMYAIARADQFLFKDGRFLNGKIVSRQEVATANPDKKSSLTDEELVIEVEPDVLVTIRKSELALDGIRVKDPGLKTYEDGTTRIQNTVESHMAAVKWSAQHGPKELQNAHYLRILDIDPSNKDARAALGHVNQSGQWERLEDRMQRMGKVKVKNQWVYPEATEISEEDLEKRRKEFKVMTNITNSNASQAMAKIEKVDDPLLTDAISDRLADRNKLAEPIKLFFIAQIARQPTAKGIRALVACSLDPSVPVHNAALDALIHAKEPEIRQAAVQLLIRLGLASSDNAQINAAGYALGKLEAEDAVLALINKLVTRHEIIIANEGNTYSDSGTFSYGNQGPKKSVVSAKNPEVLGALAQITGQGQLGYERAEWMKWYASVHAKPVEDLRRDR